MARRYYIMRDGERLYRGTVQEISRLAQKTANAIGSAVQVHYTDTATTRTGKSHRAAPTRADTNVYSRNPAKRYFAIFFQRADGSWQLAHAYKSLPQAKVKEHAMTKQGYTVRLIKASGETEARAMVGGTYKKNPVKSKLTGSRGFWVEYKMSGGKVQRLKAGNKGIATIRANELKRSGYKGVRVYSA